jgi:hypothetical protein
VANNVGVSTDNPSSMTNYRALVVENHPQKRGISCMYHVSGEHRSWHQRVRGMLVSFAFEVALFLITDTLIQKLTEQPSMKKAIETATNVVKCVKRRKILKRTVEVRLLGARTFAVQI